MYMVTWSIPLYGIRGNRPQYDFDKLFAQIDGYIPKRKEWKREYIHDSLPILDGESIKSVKIPNHEGIHLVRYDYDEVDFSKKLAYPNNSRHMLPYFENIHCEIVIDDSLWKGDYMKDYPSHNDIEKYQTVMMQAGCLITSLRLIGFNRFVVPFIIKNGCLNDLDSVDDGSLQVYFQHPFHIPSAVLRNSKSRITTQDLDWIGRSVSVLNYLFYFDDFTTTLESMNYYYGELPVRAKMMLIWSAIEDLLQPKKFIRKRVRTRSAMILGKNNDDRKRIYDYVGELYDSRNSATHGRKFSYAYGLEDIPKNEQLQNDGMSLINSYQLMCDLFRKIVDRGSRYSEKELEEMDSKYERLFPSKD